MLKHGKQSKGGDNSNWEGNWDSPEYNEVDGDTTEGSQERGDTAGEETSNIEEKLGSPEQRGTRGEITEGIQGRGESSGHQGDLPHNSIPPMHRGWNRQNNNRRGGGLMMMIIDK